MRDRRDETWRFAASGARATHAPGWRTRRWRGLHQSALVGGLKFAVGPCTSGWGSNDAWGHPARMPVKMQVAPFPSNTDRGAGGKFRHGDGGLWVDGLGRPNRHHVMDPPRICACGISQIAMPAAGPGRRPAPGRIWGGARKHRDGRGG
jgi:hypothetical protein